MNVKKYLKKQEGILVSDAIIAILVILLFIGVISSLITNVVLETTKTKMSSRQMDIATEVLEYANKLPYLDTTATTLNNYASELEVANNNIYDIEIEVENYNSIPGNEIKENIIKTITVTVTSSLRNKEYSTTISILKKATPEEILEIL